MVIGNVWSWTDGEYNLGWGENQPEKIHEGWEHIIPRQSPSVFEFDQWVVFKRYFYKKEQRPTTFISNFTIEHSTCRQESVKKRTWWYR